MNYNLKWTLISMGGLFYCIISYYHDPTPGSIPFIFAFLYIAVNAFLEYIKYSNKALICILLAVVMMIMWIVMVNEISHISSIPYILVFYLITGFVTLIMLGVSFTCLKRFRNKIKKFGVCCK